MCAVHHCDAHLLAIPAHAQQLTSPLRPLSVCLSARQAERLKPLKGQTAVNDVDSLELAAAEMAAAAAELVAREREIITLR